MKRITFFIVVLLAVAGALAQPDPNHPDQAVPPKIARQNGLQFLDLLRRVEQHTLLASTPSGLIMLRGGVLAKYNSITLQQQGMLQLFGPLPELPEAQKLDDMPPADKMRVFYEQSQRFMPAVLQMKGNQALIVLGEQFFRVNVDTMKSEATSSWYPPTMPMNPDRLMAMSMPTTLELNGNTLYVTRGMFLLAIDIQDGRIFARERLPIEAQPAAKALALLQDQVRGGKNVRGEQPAEQPPVEMTVVGILKQHPEIAGNCWTVKDDQGNEYLLQGDAVKGLKAENANTRVRIHGMLSQRMDQPKFCKGTLEAPTTQPLPKEE